MRTETRYYAIDDTEFDSAEECLAYEAELKTQLDGFLLFDEHGQPLTFKDSTYREYDAISSYLRVIYIVDADKAIHGLKWLSDQTGCYLPPLDELDSGQIWYDDTDQWDWVNLTERYNTCKSIIQSIQSVINVKIID